jgi:hypothetical protein
LALADSFRDGCSWLIYSERKVAFGRLVLAGLVVQLISRLMWLFFWLAEADSHESAAPGPNQFKHPS